MDLNLQLSTRGQREARSPQRLVTAGGRASPTNAQFSLDAILCHYRRHDRTRMRSPRPARKRCAPPQTQSGHPASGMPALSCPWPPALTASSRTRHHVVRTVVDRRIPIGIRRVAIRRRSRGTVAAPVKSGPARIEPLRQPVPLLAALTGCTVSGAFRWKVTSASAGIQTPGPDEAAEAAVPAAAPAPAPIAAPAPPPAAQPMMVPSSAPPIALPTVRPALFGPFTLNWSDSSG